MIYSKKQIQLFCRLLKGDNEARAILSEEVPEFIAFNGAVLGEVKPTQWLIQNNKLLAMFFDLVINGNNTAVKILLAKKEYGFAAAANYYKGDEKAGVWLKTHNLDYYAELAEAIKYAEEHRKKGGGIFDVFGSI